MAVGDLAEGLGELAADVGESGQHPVDASVIRFVDPGLDRALLAASSPILAAGQARIADMRETTGSGGEPGEGDRLIGGALGFEHAAEVLKSARPTDDWTGAGADAYSAAGSRQEGRTVALAELDRRLHQVIAAEASQLASCRRTLDHQSNWLAGVGSMTGLVPGLGTAAKDAAELEAVTKALSVCSAALERLSGEVGANAVTADELAGRYAGMAGGAAAGPGGPPTGSGGATPAALGSLPLGGAPAGAVAGGGLAALIADVIEAATEHSHDAEASEDEASEDEQNHQPMTATLDRGLGSRSADRAATYDVDIAR